MPKPKSRKKKRPKRVLALPDLEHAKTAVLNSLTSASGQRTYDHAIREFVACYCSEPRLAFNRTVVLRYRTHLEHGGFAPATINLRLAAVRRIAYEAADASRRRTICDGHVPVCATWQAANSTRSSSCLATSLSRRRSATSDASSNSGLP
jgi:hypothetical protein